MGRTALRIWPAFLLLWTFFFAPQSATASRSEVHFLPTTEQREYAPGVRFDHYNGRGDVVSQTDGAGATQWEAAYEAYGKRVREVGTTKDRQKANTKDEDPTGLLNEGMRYRDLETGVWLSRDPAGFVDGPNLYAYVTQNPWSKFDPEGLHWRVGTDISHEQYEQYKEKLADQYPDTEKRDVRSEWQPRIPESVPGKVGYGLASIGDGVLNAGVAIFSGPGKGAIEPNPIRRSLDWDPPFRVNREAYREFQDSTEAATHSTAGRSRIVPKTQSQMAYERAAQLKEQMPENVKGRVTMAVGILRDPMTGKEVTILATSEPRGYIRSGVGIGLGERVVSGNSHAERNIIGFAKANGLDIIAIAPTRPFCDTCLGASYRATRSTFNATPSSTPSRTSLK